MDKTSSFFYIYIKLITYFIFLYSGLIKWIPFPIDFTLLFGFFTIVFILNDLKNDSFKLNDYSIGYLYVAFYTFSILYMLTYLYSDSTVYASIKFKGVLLSTIAFTFPITSIRAQYFKYITPILSFLAVLMVIFLSFLLYNDLFLLFVLPEDKQLKLFDAVIPTYLDVGSFISVAFILLLNHKSKFSILLKIVIFYFLIILGGRGPLLALILIVMVNFYLNTNTLSKYVKYIFLFLFAVLLYIYFDLTFIDFDRLNIFQNYGSDTATAERVEYIGKCISSFFENPIFGRGIGSTGIIISGSDIVLYPHNLFIEILAEFGLIGFILFTTVFFFFLYVLFIKKVPLTQLSFILIVFYLFFQDMKSGAFEAWRISCGWLAIATVILNYNSNQSELKIA